MTEGKDLEPGKLSDAIMIEREDSADGKQVLFKMRVDQSALTRMVLRGDPLAEKVNRTIVLLTNIDCEVNSEWALPQIPQEDALIRAISRIPLPTIDLVRTLKKGMDEGRFCRIWAIIVAADLHRQTETGERFSPVSQIEAARYDPVIPLWWNSKSADGGAMKLTQVGFEPIMMRERDVREHRQPDTDRQLLTNDGRRGRGYRFVATGEQVFAYLRRTVAELQTERLKKYFNKWLDAIEKLGPVSFFSETPNPSHHVIMTRLTYGINRRVEGANKGYLTVTLSPENTKEFVAKYFPDLRADEELRFGVVRTPDGKLQLWPDRRGWKVSGSPSSNIQVSSLREANIAEPKTSIDVVTRYINAPIEHYPSAERPFVIRMPASIAYKNRKGTGFRTRNSGGSPDGRAKAHTDDDPSVTTVDLKAA